MAYAATTFSGTLGARTQSNHSRPGPSRGFFLLHDTKDLTACQGCDRKCGDESEDLYNARSR
jgi:hypothetical protein